MKAREIMRKLGYTPELLSQSFQGHPGMHFPLSMR